MSYSNKINTTSLTITIFFLSVISIFGSQPDYFKLILDLLFLITINVVFIISLKNYFIKPVIINKPFYKCFTEVVCASFSNVFIFSSIYRFFGINSSDSVVFDIPSALYFSIVTWTTLGYGDLSPTKDARFFSAAEALMGYIYMALMISIFVVYITQEGRKHR